MRRIYALFVCTLFIAIPAAAENDPLYRSVFCDIPGPVEFVLRTALAKKISLKEATNEVNITLEGGGDTPAPCGYGYYTVKKMYELGEFTVEGDIYEFVEAEVTATAINTEGTYGIWYLKRYPLGGPMFLFSYKWKGTK